MDNTATVRIEFNEKEKVGNLLLFLEIEVIKKYCSVDYLHGYNKDAGIGLLNFPIRNNAKVLCSDLKSEIEQFDLIIDKAGLLNKNESTFHNSHLLCIIQEFNKTKGLSRNQQDTNVRLSNRIELLKELNELTRESNYNYDISIKKTGWNDFEYKFSGEPLLKKRVLRYLIGEVRSSLKIAYPELWKMYFENAENFDEETIQILSDYEVTQNAVGKLSKNLLDYLNNETIALRNKNKEVHKLSVTNKQGEFIYDILTLFGAYTPQKRSVDESIKRTHHNAIRKLIQRYNDNIEDS